MPFGFGRKRRHLEMPADEEDWIGHAEPHVEFEGRLKISNPEGLFRLNCLVKGEIVSEGKVVVAEQADVEANIRTRLVTVYGKVKGSIHASERIEVMEHGIVLGDIHTPCLVIDPGGYFDGQCHMPFPESEKHTTQGVDSKEMT